MGPYCRTMDHTSHTDMARSASRDRLAERPESADPDADRAFVVCAARDLVRMRAADWVGLRDGEIELQLKCGRRTLRHAYSLMGDHPRTRRREGLCTIGAENGFACFLSIAGGATATARRMQSIFACALRLICRSLVGGARMPSGGVH